MLSRSKPSAMIMSVISLLVAVIVTSVFIMARHFLTGETLVSGIAEGSTNSSTGIFAIPISIVFIGLHLVLASSWIYARDESHFGLQGALRWAIFGGVFALLAQIYLAVIPFLTYLKSPAEAGLAAVVNLGLGWGTLALSYWLSFKALPLGRKK